MPGFGDPDARILIVGPGAGGARRQSDRAGVHRRRLRRLPVGRAASSGLADRPPVARRADDGLILSGVYIAAAVRCAPPANKPTLEERDTCAPFLVREMGCSHPSASSLALGAFGWDAALRALRPRPRAGGQPAAVRARRRGDGRAVRARRHVPPVAAEHVHRTPDAGDVRCRDRSSDRDRQRIDADAPVTSASQLRPAAPPARPLVDFAIDGHHRSRIYDVLGVAREAPAMPRSSAPSRKLAQQWHPDVNKDPRRRPGSRRSTRPTRSCPTPTRRQRYDMFGRAGVDGGAGAARPVRRVRRLQRHLRCVLRGRGRRAVHAARSAAPAPTCATTCASPSTRPSRARQGDRVHVARPLRDVRAARRRAGTSPRPARSARAGRGAQVRQTMLGQMVNVSACPRCRGEGKIVETPCATCRGDGRSSASAACG